MNMACPWINEKASRTSAVPKVMLHGQDVSRHGETQKPDKQYRFASMEIGSFFLK